MRITDYDDINHTELVGILGIGLVAAIRGGVLTDRQKASIERKLARAKKREDAKRADKAAKQ